MFPPGTLIIFPVSYTHLDVYKRQDQCGKKAHTDHRADKAQLFAQNGKDKVVAGFRQPEVLLAAVANAQACLLYTSRCV